MNISAAHLTRLASFINRIEEDTYPESPTFVHTKLTETLIDRLDHEYALSREMRILDIGCGQGPALDKLRDMGFTNLTGITLNDQDLQVCRDKGHNVFKMDQSFLDFDDSSFDFVWARHVIEHSIFPTFTLTEFRRILVPRGLMYLETPAPDTSCHHETNPNHYSVLSHNAWLSLLQRGGFAVENEGHYRFPTPSGPDEYYGFICRKQ